jgi:predicted outer membrane repeat protein
VLGTCALLLAPGSASAANFVVNSLSDGSPNGCTTGPQGCTLEEAITDANSNGSSDTDQISFSVTGTIPLTTGLPTIITPATITGPSAAELQVVGNTISGSPKTIFAVDIPAGQLVRIERIKIADARATGFAGGGIGKGGAGTLELDSVWLFDNFADQGGGIFLNRGTVSIRDSTLSNNEATFGGGAIVARRANMVDPPGTATLTNSTLTNNRAKEFGGAINVAEGATVTILSSTIAGNTANSDNTISGDGGGIFNNASIVNIANTILAGNSVGAGGGSNSQCLGTFSSSGYNLRSVADPNCTGFNTGLDIVNGNPLLGTLGENGGLTPTIPLLTGSPGINAGNPAVLGGAYPVCPATDQRGRPRGGVAATCDIGAFERLGHTTTTTVFCTPASLTLGAGSATCNVTVADTSSPATNPMGNVSFTSSGSGTFSGGGSCLLLGNAGAPGCQVTYTPTAAGSGSHRITASYPGDVDHAPSQGAAQIAVIGPAGIGPGTSPNGLRRAIRKCKKKFPKGKKRKKCIKRAKKRARA